MERAVPATNLQEKARQGNFGSVGGGGGGGVVRGAAGVRDMEKSVVRRPVYGGRRGRRSQR